MIRRVAFYLHALEEGGAQRRILTLAQCLAERGIAVDLLVVKAEGPLRALVPPQVSVRPVGALLSALPWIRAQRRRQVRAAVPEIALYLRRLRPDVLVAAANHTALASERAHRLAGCADVALVLRVSNPLTSRTRTNQVKRDQAMERALRNVDVVATVSQSLALEAESLCVGEPRPEIRAVLNPVVDGDAARRLREAGPPRRDPGDPVRIVTGMGRLVEQKDFDTLIRAFAEVARVLPVRLRILGEGPLRSDLEALVAQLGVRDRVELPGHVDDPLPQLHASDVYVLSSRWEGMPSSLIEAMACGCRVVSTDLPPTREVLLDGKLAPLVPVRDVPAMARALREALEARTGTEDLVRQAERFTYQSAADDFLAVLEVARARRRARTGQAAPRAS
jgi:glycosyltransferase involved in cell wall biosynthesis